MVRHQIHANHATQAAKQSSAGDALIVWSRVEHEFYGRSPCAKSWRAIPDASPLVCRSGRGAAVWPSACCPMATPLLACAVGGGQSTASSARLALFWTCLLRSCKSSKVSISAGQRANTVPLHLCCGVSNLGDGGPKSAAVHAIK